MVDGRFVALKVPRVPGSFNTKADSLSPAENMGNTYVVVS